ncbi:hypothetical protein [Paraburkholderia saeva]|uniref:hypothetical protein n=1 Tax=Paraburkholderia saeva TaxID=2777537 RepID=UPI001E48B743|nr:hypothetical protein [Paraburkholderia saeva]
MTLTAFSGSFAVLNASVVSRQESAKKRAFAAILDEFYPSLAAPARRRPAVVTA